MHPESSAARAALTSIPFFDNLATRRLKILEELFVRREFDEGDMIVNPAGDGTYCFHIIIKGSTRVSVEENGVYNDLKILKSGEWFGESALVGSAMKATRVTALETTSLLSLQNDKYQQFSDEYGLSVSVKEELADEKNCDELPNSSVAKAEAMQVVLKKLPLFSVIPEEKLQILADLFRFKRFKEKEIILHQGDPADDFYIIVKGRVEVSAHLEDGKMIHLDTLTNGSWFGEVALLNQTPRTATIRALGPCVMLALNREDFMSFDKVAPEVRTSSVFHSVERQRAANSLKTVPIFRVYQQKQKGPKEMFDDQTLALLGELFTLREVPANTEVFHQGDVADALYLVLKGTIQISFRNPITQKTEHLWHANENELFGEVELMEGVRRITSARTTDSPVVLFTLPLRHYARFKMVSPELHHTLMCLSSNRKAGIFQRLPFFNDVKENRPWSKMDLFGSLFALEDFSAGATLFNEGDKGDKFYLIMYGRVDVWVNRGDELIAIDSLSENAWFGEISLVYDTPRTSTIRCRTDCQFLSLTKKRFRKFVQIAPELCDAFTAMISVRTANSLRSMKLFKGITENKPWSKLDLIASAITYRTDEPNKTIIKAGACRVRFYYIVSGKCVCTIKGVDGKEVELEELGPNSYFGEMSLLENVRACATIKTVEATTFITLNRKTFAMFLAIAPEVRPEILKKVEERHRRMDESGIHSNSPIPVMEHKDGSYSDASEVSSPAQTPRNSSSHKCMEKRKSVQPTKIVAPKPISAHSRTRSTPFATKANLQGERQTSSLNALQEHGGVASDPFADFPFFQEFMQLDDLELDVNTDHVRPSPGLSITPQRSRGPSLSSQMQ